MSVGNGEITVKNGEKTIDAWLWEKPTKLQRVLRQRGYQGEFKTIKMSSWRNNCSQHAHYSIPNSLFDELKLFDMSKVDTGISVPCDNKHYVNRKYGSMRGISQYYWFSLTFRGQIMDIRSVLENTFGSAG